MSARANMNIEMNMLLAVILLPFGLAILIKGADLLIEGAVSISQRLGISPLIVGLTVVAMGTSAPEVAASITAAISDKGNMAIGNVYGSNIANLALVGGICAIIRPIRVKISMVRRELPAMVIVAVLLLPFLWNLELSRLDSIVMLAMFALIMVLSVHFGLKDSKNDPEHVQIIDEGIKEKKKRSPKSIIKAVVFIVIGLVGLTAGAKATVESASFIGSAIGLSEAVIGLTIVAIGTSLPELMTCVIAAMKGHDDISLGNIVGSNMFNTLLVVGAAGVAKPFSIEPRLIGIDYWIMVSISLIFLLIAWKFKKIGRKSGILLACFYAGYLLYLLAIPGMQ